MTIFQFLETIKDYDDYVPGSLYLKSYDNYGCVYKWLEKGILYGRRRKIFIELDPNEHELELVNKTYINSIEVFPAD